jgi:hypothetical protein
VTTSAIKNNCVTTKMGVKMKAGFGETPPEINNDESILHISPSAIMEFLKSPAHYHAKYIRGIKKKTKAMEQGNQVHMAMLEGERFFQTYCREPNKSDFPNSLATKEEWDAIAKVLGLKGVSALKKDDLKKKVIETDSKYQQLDWDWIVKNATQGKQIISETDWNHIEQLMLSLDYNPRLKKLFSRNGWREQRAWIYDDEAKILYKFKTDFVDETGVIVDIKKTPDASLNGFSRKIYFENLYVQGAMYFDLWTELHKITQELKDEFEIPIPKPRAFVFAAFEMESPYIWQDYKLDPGAMDAGEQRYKKALIRLQECRAENVWPSYNNKMEDISLPHFAWEQLERLANAEIPQ